MRGRFLFWVVLFEFLKTSFNAVIRFYLGIIPLVKFQFGEKKLAFCLASRYLTENIMNLGDLHNVWEIKALKKPGEEEARKILEKIAKQVQPIMRKRKWRVKLLSEFCPKNPSLLGLNVGGGVHVKLRLRRPNRDWDFYPFDQILDTMLHELCHNVHGPHNASFYQLWDELRKECEQLMSKGVTGTGEGFDLPGRRLGGFSRQPPLSSLHKTALAAAEKRACLGCLLPSGPNRLGGDSVIMAALSPIQAAAMAAERRLQDDIWCASHSEISGDIDTFEDPFYTEQNSLSSRDHGGCHEHAVEAKTQKRSHGSDTDSSFHYSNNQLERNFVDLTRSASSSMSLLDHGTRSPKRSCKSNNFAPSQSTCPSESSVIDSFSVSSSSNLDARHSSEESSMWECGSCTLLNPPLAPICELCNTIKPKDAAAKYKFWSCKFCTLENSAKLDKCSACGQWRYSYGPPVSMPAPNLGT